MPKQKQFLTDKKKKSKHAVQAPTTADEFLAAGVDFEEAGEKWRAGDAAKSTRFFLRAIDCYDEALKKFPNSFDLAYNKARVQYELTQHPKLLDQLPGSLLDLLQAALDSSRIAMKLNEDNADVLFNTAQCLTSLDEAINEGPGQDADKSMACLVEALRLFNNCLALQEKQHVESKKQEEAMDADTSMATTADPPQIFAPTSSMSEPQEEQWATIIEPVTNETLVDTIIVQLETLTTASKLLASSNLPDVPEALAFIDTYSETILAKLSLHITPSTQIEANITRALFLCAFANVKFRCATLSVEAYYEELETLTLSLQTPEHLVDKAEALLTFNLTLRQSPSESRVEMRWSALAGALESLTAASKIPGTESLARIHLLRGDGELLRLQLAEPPLSFAFAVRNAKVLAQNAEKAYRGAAALAKNETDDDLVLEASVKEALAKAIAGDDEERKTFVGKIRGNYQLEATIQEAMQDGVVSEGMLRLVGLIN